MALRTVLRRFRRPPTTGLSPTPLSAYELVTRQAVEDLERTVARLETKVNALLGGAILTILLEVWRTLLRGSP